MRKIMHVGDRLIEFICDSDDELAVWEVYFDGEHVGETDEPMDTYYGIADAILKGRM
jgi:hypothetical protein